MRNRGLRRRIAMLVTSVALVSGIQVAAAPATFAATPQPNYQCNNWGDIGWAFGANTKPWVVVDAYPTSLAPGSTLSKGHTMTTTHTVQVSVSATVASSAEAGVFFAKASLSASLTLAGMYSSTDSLSDTTTISVTNTTTHQRDFVIYQAVRKVTMMAYRWQCTRSLAWNFITSGSLISYASASENSIACDLAYAAGTAQASAKTYC
jgi:hypothetical protein